MTALDDQAAAGAIMWVLGSVAFLIPAACITIQVLQGRVWRCGRSLEGLEPRPLLDAACPFHRSPRQGLCQREGVGPYRTMPARMTGCRQCATPSAHGRAPGEAPGCPSLAVSQARLGHQPPREAGAGLGGTRRASRPLEVSGISFAHSLGQHKGSYVETYSRYR